MIKVYLGGTLLPYAPSSIEVKTKNQNRTITLIDGAEISFPAPMGLTTFTLHDVLLPSLSLDIAPEDAEEPLYYVSEFEELKKSKKPFPFIVSEIGESGAESKIINGDFQDTEVTLENYTVNMDCEENGNYIAQIELKIYVPFGVSVNTVSSDGKIKKKKNKKRTEKKQTKQTTYVVKQGDTLWAIAKMFYGDGSKYMAIYNANTNILSNPNLIYPGQKLIIPDTKTAGNTSVKKSKTTQKTQKSVKDNVKVISSIDKSVLAMENGSDFHISMSGIIRMKNTKNKDMIQ